MSNQPDDAPDPDPSTREAARSTYARRVFGRRRPRLSRPGGPRDRWSQPVPPPSELVHDPSQPPSETDQLEVDEHSAVSLLRSIVGWTLILASSVWMVMCVFVAPGQYADNTGVDDVFSTTIAMIALIGLGAFGYWLGLRILRGRRRKRSTTH